MAFKGMEQATAKEAQIKLHFVLGATKRWPKTGLLEVSDMGVS